MEWKNSHEGGMWVVLVVQEENGLYEKFVHYVADCIPHLPIPDVICI